MSFEDLMDAFNSGDEVSCYKTMKVRDFIEFNPKESLKKGELATKVTMDKLLPFEKFISSMEQAPFSGGSKFKNGDTLLARITPCLENGKTAFVDGLKDGEVAFGSTEFIVLRCREGVSDPQYIYYLATSSFFRNVAIKSMVGSSGRQRVQIGALEDIDIKVPSLEEQRKIASRLALLDSKIALNSRINDNLQEQARALFKAWFVDYIPFGGSKPANWKAGKLKDILLLKRNAIKPGENTELNYLPIDAIPMNTFAVSEVRPNNEAQSSLITFNRDDIIIGAMRIYFHRVIIAPFDGITRTTCFTLCSRSKEYLAFNLLCCDQDSTIEYAQATSRGSTMPYAVWDGGLGEMMIEIPDKAIALEFNEIVLPIIRTIQSSFLENKRLQELRDGLLPRLITGELDVSGLEL